jgi:diamine N-acetyltransferase
MLDRRPVERDHLAALFALSVRADQQGLVAPNVRTIAQAAYEPGSYVWGLWEGQIAVGLMAVIHPGESPHLDPTDDPQAAYLWRLMIGADHQGKGHGRAAIGHLVAIARAWTLPRIAASVVDAPHSNLGFYERLGFRWTGRITDGEKVIAMNVADVPG